MTSAAHGAGRVTTVGTVPDDAFARALLTWLVPVDDDWRRLAVQPVTVLSATSARGPAAAVRAQLVVGADVGRRCRSR